MPASAASKVRPEPASVRPSLGKPASGKSAVGKSAVKKASSGKTAGKLAPGKRCPICGKPAAAESDPFCSPRCRDVDLNRWLSGSYVIPGKETDEEDAE
jgi:uncharacterized protein